MAGESIANSIIIRSLSMADIPPLVQMEQAIFSTPWSKQNFEDLFLYPYNIDVVAEADGEILGCACMTMLGTEGEIDKVMVADRFRQKGIGAMLLQELLERGRERGGEAFTLEVRKSNVAAIRLYERAGFVSEGIRPGFYEKPKEDALIMWSRPKA